jgi:hypothetical protein
MARPDESRLSGAEVESNWLPVPDGPFALALRIYWPEQDILDGLWTPSSIKKTLHTSLLHAGIFLLGGLGRWYEWVKGRNDGARKITSKS